MEIYSGSSQSRNPALVCSCPSQSGIQLARRVLGDGLLLYESVEPGRQGKSALLDGWKNMLLLSEMPFFPLLVMTGSVAGRADALVATSRSSYALLASGMGGGLMFQSGRPFYDVYADTCIKVTCALPVTQTVESDRRFADIAAGDSTRSSPCCPAGRLQHYLPLSPSPA
eukprot:755167-Hanusia_phi.AAC.1